MGLFGSSKPPEPQPVLFFKFTHPQEQIFEPDSVVSGHVALTTPIPISPQAIEVSLFGFAKVWIRENHSSNNSTNYHHFRDNAPLFNLTYNLLGPPPKAGQPEQLLPGQIYRYPFSIRFPAGTGNNRTGLYRDSNDTRWTTLPHSLPPTFFSGCRGGVGLSHDPEPDYAEVQYGITTRLICPGVGIGKYHQDPISATVPLTFQPTNTHLHDPLAPGLLRHTKPFLLQSLALAGADPAQLGFRKRIHSHFSSSIPSLNFELAVEIPDLLTSGAEFRFRAHFTVLQKSDNVVKIPPIKFRVVSCKLLNFTFFRAPRDWEASSMASGSHNSIWSGDAQMRRIGWGTSQESVVYREGKMGMNCLPQERVVELVDVPVPSSSKLLDAKNPDSKKEEEGEVVATKMDQAIDCEAWFMTRVPGFTEPSFVSFNVCRVYRVKVKMEVEVGGKPFEYSVESFVRALGGGGVVPGPRLGI